MNKRHLTSNATGFLFQFSHNHQPTTHMKTFAYYCGHTALGLDSSKGVWKGGVFIDPSGNGWVLPPHADDPLDGAGVIHLIPAPVPLPEPPLWLGIALGALLGGIFVAGIIVLYELTH
jgi:hypothetical protein